MTKTTTIKSLLLAIAGVFLLSSCIKDNLDNCFSGLRLSFNFVLHENGGNRFGEEVQQVRVYLFDETGVLKMIASDAGNHLTNDYKMNIDIDAGKYTVIAYAGDNKNFDESYFDAEMIDAPNSSYNKGVVVGETTIDNFRVILNHNIANDIPEDVVPVVNDLSDLYYGAVGSRTAATSKYVIEEVEIKSGEFTERSIELIKNTNILKVTISGLEYLSQSQSQQNTPDILEIWATATNGRYLYNNTIDKYARSIRYTPFAKMGDVNIVELDIKTIRFDLERHTSDPVLLNVKNSNTGVMLLSKPIDVLATLLQAKDAQTGEYIYKNQEDLDRVYEHPIDIRINVDLSVSIFVKDWEIITLKPDLSIR